LAKIDLSDATAVVIIGSGAGGGTLAHELTSRGIKVVLLEAGKRQSLESFSQAGRSLRTTHLARSPHPERQLGRRAGLSNIASVALQDSRRNHGSLDSISASSSTLGITS